MPFVVIVGYPRSPLYDTSKSFRPFFHPIIFVCRPIDQFNWFFPVFFNFLEYWLPFSPPMFFQSIERISIFDQLRVLPLEIPPMLLPRTPDQDNTMFVIRIRIEELTDNAVIPPLPLEKQNVFFGLVHHLRPLWIALALALRITYTESINCTFANSKSLAKILFIGQ